MKPSESQLKIIKRIENNLNKKFKGRTMHEAREWISKNMKMSKLVAMSYEQVSIRNSIKLKGDRE